MLLKNIQLSTLQLALLLSRLVSPSCCEFGMIYVISGRNNGWRTCIVEWLCDTAMFFINFVLDILRFPRMWDILCTKLLFDVNVILFWYLLHVWIFSHINCNMSKCESSLILFRIQSYCTVSLQIVFYFYIWLYCTVSVLTVGSY